MVLSATEWPAGARDGRGVPVTAARSIAWFFGLMGGSIWISRRTGRLFVNSNGGWEALACALFCIVANAVLARPGILTAEQIGHLGVQNVWRAVADWLDLVMPAVVLASLAIGAAWFGPAEPAAPGALVSRAERLMAPAGLLACVVAVSWPGVLRDYGIFVALPFLLLIPSGVRQLRHLPFFAADLALSLFSASCYAGLAALTWIPWRRTGDLVLAAWFGL